MDVKCWTYEVNKGTNTFRANFHETSYSKHIALFQYGRVHQDPPNER